MFHVTRCLMLLGCALLAACQPLPRPFQTPAFVKDENPLLVLRDVVGVTVLPPDGLPADQAARLADAVATALRDAGLPAAVAEGNRGSFILRGAAVVHQLSAREDELAILWQIEGRDGSILGGIRQREPVVHGLADGPPPAHLAQIAQRTAAELAPLMQDTVPGEQVPVTVAVHSVQGAPSDGNTRLRRALEQLLRERGVRIAEARDADPHTVVATVTMGSPSAGEQDIAIRWVLLAPDGAEIGEVNQENRIPAGSLDRGWGDTALLAAEEAADGIAAIVERLREPVAAAASKRPG